MKLSPSANIKILAVLVTAFGLVGCESPSTAGEQTPPVYPGVVGTPQPPLVTVTNVAIPNAVPEAAVEGVGAAELPEPPLAKPVDLSPALQEIVKLAESGVDDDVILAYIQNSPVPFNPTPEEIIYLTDIGLSDVVITAMVNHRRDQPQAAQPPANVAPAVTPPQATPPPAAASSQAAPAATYNPEPQVVYSTPPVVQYVNPQPTVEYSYFYSSLAPYGSWMEVADYGWCWQPSVVRYHHGWQPYGDRGRWAYTDYGWYWQSDYSWGWGPFHYGRWFHHPRRGWCWKPDSVWAPAWVSWRYTDSHCGWAPLPPGAHYRAGLGFTYYGAHVSASFSFGLHRDAWTFVPAGRFHDRDVWRHRLPARDHHAVYGRSRVINNYVIQNNTIINKGVGPERLPGLGRVEPRKVAFHDSPARPGAGRPIRSTDQRNEIVAYRPTNLEASRRTLRDAEPDVTRSIRSTSVRDGRPGTGVTADPRKGLAPSVGTPGAPSRSEPSPVNSNVGNRPGGQSTRGGSIPSVSGRPTSVTAPAGVTPGERRPGSSPAQTIPSSGSPSVSRPGTLNRQEPSKSAVGNPVISSPGRVEPQVSRVPATVTQPSARSVPGRATPQPSTISTPAARQEVQKPSTWYAPGKTTYSAPAQSSDRSPSSSVPEVRSRPPIKSFTGPAPTAPVPTYNPPSLPSRPAYSAPAIESRPAPSYSAPAIQSRPSYSAPAVQSRPAPSYSAPAVQSRPAPSYSAPAVQSRPSYSAPAVQSRPSAAPSYSPAARPPAKAGTSPAQGDRPGNRR